MIHWRHVDSIFSPDKVTNMWTNWKHYQHEEHLSLKTWSVGTDEWSVFPYNKVITLMTHWSYDSMIHWWHTLVVIHSTEAEADKRDSLTLIPWSTWLPNVDAHEKHIKCWYWCPNLEQIRITWWRSILMFLYDMFLKIPYLHLSLKIQPLQIMDFN